MGVSARSTFAARIEDSELNSQPENTAQETAERSSKSHNPQLSEFFRKEAIILLYFSGASYLFAYAFKVSYFGYFGITSIIVSIGVEDIVRPAFFFVMFVVLMSSAFLLPAVLFRWVYSFVYIFRFPAIFSAFLVGEYQSGGITWFFVILLLMAVLSLFYEVWLIVRALAKGMPFAKYVEFSIGYQMDAHRNETVDGRIGELFGQGFWTTIMAALLLPFFFGYWSGELSAHGERTFLVYESDGSEYAVLARQGAEMIAGKLSAPKPGEASRHLIDIFRVSQVDSFDGVDLVYTHFSDGIREKKATQRTTFRDWFNANFGEAGQPPTAPASPAQPAAPAARP